LYGSFFYLFW